VGIMWIQEREVWTGVGRRGGRQNMGQVYEKTRGVWGGGVNGGWVVGAKASWGGTDSLT